MRRRPAAEVPRITSRSKLRSPSSITSSVHQIPLPSVLRQSSPPKKTELRYHTSSQMGQLLRELREDKGSYFGHLTCHLATCCVGAFVASHNGATQLLPLEITQEFKRV